MRFIETAIAGAFIIEPEPISDERGFFARILDEAEFHDRGLTVPAAQWSVAFNATRGTLRGMHFQVAPHQEVKIVRCTRGAIYDVLLDVRNRRWISVDVTAENRRMLYIPPGVAHGYQTLQDGTELSYYISQPYRPESGAGVRWNDPAFSVSWPIADPVMSEQDRSFPDWND